MISDPFGHPVALEEAISIKVDQNAEREIYRLNGCCNRGCN